MTLDLGRSFDAGAGIGHEARPVGVGLAFRVAEGGDGFRLGDLVREHVAKWAKLANLELFIAHGFDFGVVVGGDVDLHFAADLFADQLADLLVDRCQARRSIERLDAETDNTAVWAILVVLGIGCGRHKRGGEDREGCRQIRLLHRASLQVSASLQGAAGQSRRALVQTTAGAHGLKKITSRITHVSIARDTRMKWFAAYKNLKSAIRCRLEIECRARAFERRATHSSMRS